MTMRFGYIWLLCGLAAFCPTSARAGNAPPQLYNKSISLSWTESRDATTVEGEKKHRVVNSDLGIYVSSAGRVFSQTGTTGLNRKGKHEKNARGASVAPDGSTIKTNNKGSVGVFSFDGHSISATSQFESGARRITVTFDDGFRSCTANIMYGKEANIPGVIKHGMSGQLRILTSVSTSTPTCSMRDGNIFAD